LPLEVLRNAYFVVTLDDRSTSNQIVRMVRSSAGFSSLEALREHHLQLIARLDRLGRKNRCLLIDLRDAPGRRDPEFEAVMRELRPKMFAGWRRIGVLTASALGMMQVRRHTREDGVEALSSTSEAEILSFLAKTDGV
jgi:hypothetical protein